MIKNIHIILEINVANNIPVAPNLNTTMNNIFNKIVLVAEIKLLGKALQEAGKGKEAIQVVNLNLGQDDNGIQRTLDMMNQDNVQVLEVILLELIWEKNI